MHLGQKIQSSHLERQAVIYIRQSSLYQVQNHLESQKRQYALKEHALKLGWSLEQIVIIDEDLGLSGAYSENRPGYQRLISLLALRKVGLILGIELSRLARNCLDWYQLLELASTFDTLIADEDSIFHPADYNDRLLLGLKGTISEAELYQIKNRMMRGRINKAQRGELEITLPIGYERAPGGKTRKTADQAVGTAIETIFHLFQQLRSVRGVLLEFRRRNQPLPYWKKVPGLGKQMAWRPPTYDAIYAVISNSSYAGIYSYGKRKRYYNAANKKHQIKTIESAQVDIMIREHHEAYISEQQYKENLNVLRNNSYTEKMSQGAVRKGIALLQGLVYCKTCGLKMRPRYSTKRFYYCCDRDHRRFGNPICGWASAQRVDNVVEEHLLNVLNEGTIDLTFELAKRYQAEKAIIQKQAAQKIKRLEYEANLARRRYESVDPENRLVASTLEREWEEKLSELTQTKSAFIQEDEKIKDGLSAQEAKEALHVLPEYWRENKIEARDKKEIIRCVIEKVFINTKGKVLEVEVNWYGGSIIKFGVPKYIYTNTNIYHRVVDLAGEKTDEEIADILNQENILTVKQKLWTPRRLMDFRLSNNIPSGFTRSKAYKLESQGYITSKEAAILFRVSISVIQKWVDMGILKARPRLAKQAKLWVYVDEDIKKRFEGTAAFDNSVKTFKGVMKAKGMSPKELTNWIEENKHDLIRLRRGSRLCFYIRFHNP